MGTCHWKDNWLYSTNCLPVVIKPFQSNGSFKLFFGVSGGGRGGWWITITMEREREAEELRKQGRQQWAVSLSESSGWLRGRFVGGKTQGRLERGGGDSRSPSIQHSVVYLVCLLAADAPSLHLVSGISRPEGTGRWVHLCAPSVPFSLWGSRFMETSERRGELWTDSVSVSLSPTGAKSPLVIGVSLVLTDPGVPGAEG